VRGAEELSAVLDLDHWNELELTDSLEVPKEPLVREPKEVHRVLGRAILEVPDPVRVYPFQHSPNGGFIELRPYIDDPLVGLAPAPLPKEALKVLPPRCQD